MSASDPPTDHSDAPLASESSAEASPDRPAPSPKEGVGRRAPRHIRRVPRPRTTGLFDSPVRNLTVGVVAYTVAVMIVATVAYMRVGWSFRDAIYMVIVTVYTVG